MVTGAMGYARFGRTPAHFSHPAPLLAEHSVEVLRDYGVTEDRIAALLETGAAVQG
jgi:crotonobetainyl-CoA:carnitine CoA-transferase CaiB-like acyl-CoA transferase